MTAIDRDKLKSFIFEKVMPETGAAMTVLMAIIGDKTGLFRAMDGAGPLTSHELAQRSGTHERYVREWLAAMAAAGWIGCDPEVETFELTPEQAALFAQEENPVSFLGMFQQIGACYRDHNLNVDAFKTGQGVAWGEHSECLFHGVARFFGPKYLNELVRVWLPALDGVADKLGQGAKVADIGCGHGLTTRLMAEAFPQSDFAGFDFHEPSVVEARREAEAAGLGNVRFEVAAAKDFPGDGYDLIAYFDCLHDMGDPVGACAYAKKALAPGGTLMLVEPFAKDRLADNLNDLGRIGYAASTCICTPASLSQEVGLGLGAQAGPARLRAVTEEAGFSQFRVAHETLNHMVIEVRP